MEEIEVSNIPFTGVFRRVFCVDVFVGVDGGGGGGGGGGGVVGAVYSVVLESSGVR